MHIDKIEIIDRKHYVFGDDSFTRTAYELKRRGVKNWYFMLEVKNMKVLNIDIHDEKYHFPDISDVSIKSDMKMLIEEYSNNMWWFLRTAVKIKAVDGYQPYIMNRAIVAACWNFLKHHSFYLCTPRQSFKTTEMICGPILWSALFSPKNNIGIFGKSAVETQEKTCKMFGTVYQLPAWMIHGDDIDSHLKMMHNYIRTRPGANSEHQASALGIGASENIQFFDEAEFIKYIETIIDSSAPMYSAVIQNKIGDQNSQYCRILVGTPNIDENIDPLIGKMIPWSEKLYDLSDAYILDYKNIFMRGDKENRNIFYIEYHFQDIDIDFERVSEIRKIMNCDESFKHEVLLQR